MPATLVNVGLVLLGSAAGLLFRNRLPQALMAILTQGLGLCVLAIGVESMLGTQDTLCLIVCIVLGAALGSAAGLERRLEGAGDWLRKHLPQLERGGRFTEGFVSASLLFCVGAMAITGSIEAGLHQDYGILFSKSVIDGVTAISFAATMGVGVAFSAAPLLIYQGGITLLAGWIGPALPQTAVTEMSAVGGLLIVGIALNMLQLGKSRIRVGDLLPAVFLPLGYMPLARWLGSLG